MILLVSVYICLLFCYRMQITVNFCVLYRLREFESEIKTMKSKGIVRSC